MTITHLLGLCDVILNLYILFANDLELARKKLSRTGLKGLVCSLARMPARFPHVWFTSLAACMASLAIALFWSAPATVSQAGCFLYLESSYKSSYECVPVFFFPILDKY